MGSIMGEGDRLFRAAHLELGYWNNIPANYGLWYSYNSETSRKRREFVYSKIIPFLIRLMPEYLTARQFEVMRLCHLDYYFTQSVTANILGISQPTVNQHLKGKKRNGKNVGGAYRRIRKRLKMNIEYKNLSFTVKKVLAFMLVLIGSDMPYR